MIKLFLILKHVLEHTCLITSVLRKMLPKYMAFIVKGKTNTLTIFTQLNLKYRQIFQILHLFRPQFYVKCSTKLHTISVLRNLLHFVTSAIKIENEFVETI